MLTGDNETTANKIANLVGIETVIAKAIISSEIVPYVTYIIDVLDGKVIIKQVK